MGRHTKLAKGRKDLYYHMAKETGYRSRAAFKLLQLNRKHNFLDSCHCLIDLCAAPGGWSQVAVSAMPIGSLIIAVDLDPIPHIQGVQSFQSDITTQNCRQQLKSMLNKTPVDVVVHDGAPNSSGKYEIDSYMQNSLVLAALKLASEFLRQGGIFVTKIFRSGEHMQILYVLKQLFTSVDMTKPDSSRGTSAEIFAICKGFQGQFNKMDAAMFDPNIVLQNTQKQTANQEKMRQGSLKGLAEDLSYTTRHRSGYTRDLNRSYIDCVSFVASKLPIQALARYSAVLFDMKIDDYRIQQARKEFLALSEQGNPENPQNAIIPIQTKEDYEKAKALILENTNDEIIEQLQDVRSIGKQMLQKLLIWYHRVLKKLSDAFPIMKDVQELKIQAQQQTVDDLVQKQEELLNKQKKQELREQRRRESKSEKKLLKRYNTINQDQQNASEGISRLQEDEFLFSVYKHDLFTAKDEGEEIGEDEYSEGESEMDKLEAQIFIEDDQQKYMEKLDQQLNLFYNDLQRRRNQIKEREYEKNILAMQSKGVPLTVAERWFGQKEFKKQDYDDEQNTHKNEDQNDADGDSEFADGFPLPREYLAKTKRHEQRIKALKQEAKRLAYENRELKQLQDEHKIGEIEIVQNDDNAENQEIEIVREQDSLVDEYDSDEYAYEEIDSEDEKFFNENADKESNTHEKPNKGENLGNKQSGEKESLQRLLNKDNIDNTAMKIAMARAMLHKKSRRELEDSAYSKNYFKMDDDEYDLPAWFIADEQKNNQPQRPITAQEIQEIKENLKQWQQLPRTKKEREALARKKLHANQRMSKAQEQIQQIINRSDMSEREKARKLSLIQKQLQPKAKKTKVINSNRLKDKSQYTGKQPHGIKFVDKRMKKDLHREKQKKRHRH